MVKRFLCSVIALILVLSIGSFAVADTPTPVRLLTWANASTVEFLESIAAGFHNAYPDYELKIESVSSDQLDQTRQTRLAANDVDVIAFQQFTKPQEDWNISFWDMPNWQQFIIGGYLLDLTDYEFTAEWNKAALNANAYEGRYYTIPMATVAYNGVFYNKQIFAELGLSIPQTWDEFIEICEAIRESGVSEVMTVGAADRWPLMSVGVYGILTNWFGDDLSEISKKLVSGEMSHTDPIIMEAYAALDQFASYLEPGVTGVSYSDAPGRFASEMTAMLVDGAWSAGDIDKAEPEFEYGYFAMPGKTAREDGLDPQFGTKYDLSFAVAAKSENIDGAIAFMTYLTENEIYKAFLDANSAFTSAQDDVVSDNQFLISIAYGLKSARPHGEQLLYEIKGLGEYGGYCGFNLFYLKSLGGEMSYEDLAAAAADDWATARQALNDLQ